MPSLTAREYNPTTGEFVGNISSLSYGKISAGTHSPVKIIDLAFVGVSLVSNIKIGLIDSGGLTVNDHPTDIQADGTASNGSFGIMHSTNFDLTIAAGPLTRHYAGLNVSGTAADVRNVLIGTKSDTVSQFVYFDLELGANDLGKAAGMYKVFFDFEE